MLKVDTSSGTAYITATGLKLKSRGRVASTEADVSGILGQLNRGDARRVRKALASAGHSRFASLQRGQVSTDEN